jgi:hypothetical protein
MDHTVAGFVPDDGSIASFRNVMVLLLPEREVVQYNI